ncbi:hypothetical protein G6F42_025392 [Rhizopus arrhizus]|nr:hypothetical protein G6F42_025392 [Rhizopus arrhizus]
MYRHVSLFLSLSPDMENKMSSIDTKVFNGEKEKTLTHLNVTTEIVYDDDEIRPEDTSNLRRVAQSLPLAAGFILINEFCERFAYYGGSTPFQNYVQYGPDDPEQAGALGIVNNTCQLVLSLILVQLNRRLGG